MMSPPHPPLPVRASPTSKLNEDDDGSDEFNSEDEIISASEKDEEDDWTSFPTPEGQPAAIVDADEEELRSQHRDHLERDDISSVSVSASQVVAVVHREPKEKEESPSSSPPM